MWEIRSTCLPSSMQSDWNKPASMTEAWIWSERRIGRDKTSSIRFSSLLAIRDLHNRGFWVWNFGGVGGGRGG